MRWFHTDVWGSAHADSGSCVNNNDPFNHQDHAGVYAQKWNNSTYFSCQTEPDKVLNIIDKGAHLWLFEDISGDGVKVAEIFDGGDVLWDGLDHHLTGRQHQLVSSHLIRNSRKALIHTYLFGCGLTLSEPRDDILLLIVFSGSK